MRRARPKQHERRLKRKTITVNKGIKKKRRKVVFRGVDDFELKLLELKGVLEPHPDLWVTPSEKIAKKYGKHVLELSIPSEDIEKVSGRSKMFKAKKTVFPSKIRRRSYPYAGGIIKRKREENIELARTSERLKDKLGEDMPLQEKLAVEERLSKIKRDVAHNSEFIDRLNTTFFSKNKH